MPIQIDGAAGITFPDNTQQTTAVVTTGGGLPAYTARAWLYGDLSNTPSPNDRTILASANVSALARLAAGRARITFSIAMPDANYVTLVTADNSLYGAVEAQSAGSVDVRFLSDTGALTDPTSGFSVVIFR